MLVVFSLDDGTDGVPVFQILAIFAVRIQALVGFSWGRCIAVTTTLSEDKLMQAGPALVRKDISHISLNDILELGLCALSS
jgi:hypothetical protein